MRLLCYSVFDLAGVGTLTRCPDDALSRVPAKETIEDFTKDGALCLAPSP